MPRPGRAPLIATITLFLVTVFGAISASPSHPPWISSVVVLQDQFNTPFCSAFVIHKKNRLLMTADHCMQAIQGNPVFVQGVEVKEVYHLQGADIAILGAEEGAVLPPALPLDLTPLKGLDEVYAVGFTTEMKVIKLKTIFTQAMFPPFLGPFIVYSPNARPGMSGGPIVRWPKKGPVSVVGVNSMIQEDARLSMTRPLYLLVDHLKEFLELPPVGAIPAPTE